MITGNKIGTVPIFCISNQNFNVMCSGDEAVLWNILPGKMVGNFVLAIKDNPVIISIPFNNIANRCIHRWEAMEITALKFKPGVHFKGGKLYRFFSAGVEVLWGWPKPMASRITSEKDFFPLKPYINIRTEDPDFRKSSNSEQAAFLENGDGYTLRYIYPDGTFPVTRHVPKSCEQLHLWRLRTSEEIERDERNAYGEFYSPIPIEVRKVTANYSDRHWHMLEFMAKCPGALELVQSNPALAFCLASNWEFHKPAAVRPMRSARSLICQKQRDILKWLGFPGTESVRKTLKKVPGRIINIERALNLRDAMRNPDLMKLLTHVPQINAGVIKFASDPAMVRYITPNLLSEVAANKGDFKRPQTSFILKDSLRMMELMGQNTCGFVFNSIMEINAFHDELVVTMNNRANGWERVKRFPPPPVEGTEDIIPLIKAEQLTEEGRQQKNCIASYARSVKEGNIYIYRVLSPQRATLSLRHRGGGWVLSELKGKCNRAVTNETIRAVEEWLMPESRIVSPGRHTHRRSLRSL